MTEEQMRGAEFSPDRVYRYSLWRKWDIDKPTIMFIGLNPSTANEYTDDPTIRRVVSFARSWGYGGVYMMNLFAFVTAYPGELKKVEDPIGKNDYYLQVICTLCTQIVFAWGNFKEATDRAKYVVEKFPSAICLGTNKNGTPKHPLYISSETIPIKFK